MQNFNIKKFLAAHYRNVNWKYQNLIFATSMVVLSQILQQQKKAFKASDSKALWQFSSTPKDQKWNMIYNADWMCPSTMHRMFRKRNRTIDSALVDTIPGFWCDIDWHSNPSKKLYWGELYVSLLDMNIPPSMVIDTPRGYHLYWYLDEPLVCRWEKAPGTGTWRPKAAVSKALAWWQDISFSLHHALIQNNIPADSTCAGQTARLMRRPTAENVLYYDPCMTYSLQSLSDVTEQYRMKKTYSAMGRTIHVDEPVSEGFRNDICWRLALELAKEYRGTETGWRILSEWCSRCVPVYPLQEAVPIWKWACKKQREGKIYVTFSSSKSSKRTRQEQGKYMGKKNRLSTDEKISKAILEMQKEGISEPWTHQSELAFRAGVSRHSIIRRKKALFS